MHILIPQDIVEHLIKLSTSYSPREICGIFTGRHNSDTDVTKINNFHWIPNISSEPGQWDYLMEPQAMGDIYYSFSNNDKVKIVGIFHSHPNGYAYPSKMDINAAIQANQHIPYIIWSPLDYIRAWDLVGMVTTPGSIKEFIWEQV